MLTETQLRGMLGMFGLSGEKVFQDAGTLSGGEKTKLALAMLMVGRNNLLLLDEPTNNLDPPSRESVAAALSDWPGAIILVSHDTEFVERLAPDQGAADARRRRRLLQRQLARPRVARLTTRPGAGRPCAVDPVRSMCFDGAMASLDDDPGLPLKLWPCSNGEYLPPPLEPLPREAMRRARAAADSDARRHGWSRRRFLTSAAGLVGGLVALESRRGRPGGERWASSGAAGSWSALRRSVTSPPPKRRCTVARWSMCRPTSSRMSTRSDRASRRRRAARPTGDRFSARALARPRARRQRHCGRRDLGGARRR